IVTGYIRCDSRKDVSIIPFVDNGTGHLQTKITVLRIDKLRIGIAVDVAIGCRSLVIYETIVGVDINTLIASWISVNNTISYISITRTCKRTIMATTPKRTVCNRQFNVVNIYVYTNSITTIIFVKQGVFY